MDIQREISLKPYNTFGIDIPADYFTDISEEGELPEIANAHTLPKLIHALGGGSNILLTQPVEGLVILNKLKGIVVEKEDAEHVWVRVQSGEVWHELVMFAINNGWAGIENLALIPGTVGAAPIQNIGAYGVEAKAVIDHVHAWHWDDKTFITYKNEECRFGYRDSIFKHELKDKVFITSVSLRLNKKPVYNTSYGALAQELQKLHVTELSIRAIADAVIAIRSSKLPDPKQIGNAGSFFKNPTVPKEHFELLLASYPTLPSYPAEDHMVKVPAGWLIEQCNWKGFRRDGAGVHEKQALVLVNYGKASGEEIWKLSEDIVRSVLDKFGILLEREVQVW